ncbi:MAG: tetratricopeptide repeat protein [Methanolobus sp.]|nr:tetratricopeptide repeat protein [Methanolobus sp.]
MGMLDDVKSKKKQKAAENWMNMAESAKTLEKQIEYYSKSLDIDPYNAEAWFNKGKCLEKLGQFEEAKKCLDLAVEIDPDYQALIGKKYESNASPASFVNEDASFVSSTFEPIIEDEQDSGEWITKTPETVTTEEEEILKDDDYSFTPSVGEESIFSNAISGLNEDNGSPAIIREEEDEDVFGSSQDGSSVISEPELISDGDYVAAEKVDNVSSFALSSSSDLEKEAVKEKEDTFSSEQISATLETPSSSKDDENLIRSKESVISKSDSVSSASSEISNKPMKNEMKVGSIPSSKPINSSSPVAISGSEMVDIRIPLNETIKFWAIGIVAMLIVLIISSLI